MNRTRKWTWLSLGVGGILLAVVSTRMMRPAVTTSTPPTVEETEVVEQEEQPSALLSPEDLEFSKPTFAPGMEEKPPSARMMPPVEIRREDYRHDDRAKSGRPSEGLHGREWKPKVENKADKIPAIKDIAPLQLGEPTGIDPARGQKQAWNEVDPNGGNDGGGGGDSNYWSPPPSDGPEAAVPADDYGGGEIPPPGSAAPSDLEGDFPADPRDDSDLGVGSGD